MKKRPFISLVIFSLTLVGLAALSLLKNKNCVVSPPNKPARIVSLAPDITEILFALGLDEKIVAVSSDSDYPPETAKKDKVGTFWQPNTEAVIASKPDLVIAQWFEQQKAVADSLNRLGYRVLILKMEKIDELFSAIQKIADSADCPQAAAKLLDNIHNQLNALQSKCKSAKKVKVLWVVQNEPLRIAGRNTFVNEMIELVGGENAIGPAIQQYPHIGTEQLLAGGADVIIQSAMKTDNIEKEQQAAENFWSRWPSLPAVKNKRIYVVNGDSILRLGPRLPGGVEIIARCLHPEIFPEGTNAGK
jgi:iron complex transport system substrate-binding protein